MSLLCEPGGEWRNRAPTVRDAMGSLVSQLTANPDITKFSLPAVFLYPYSVLELTTFRALRHQSQLFKLKDLKSPVERLLHVTRWFMSAMERMETMNKKPFNPVLGEELNAWVDDPIYGRTAFKAEQVSHHPPVSACVMVNEKMGIEFISNVKFGITFNGNSVSCRLEGRACLTIRELGETYVVPNWVPDVIIQNVLIGTRRQLWSGDWSIRCEQTGLGAKMTVSEINANAGWFSAIKAGIYENIVEGSVFELKNEEEPLMKIDGHAGTKVFVTDTKTDEKSVLFDSDTLVMEKISFLPVEMRPAYSSLVIWKATADALVVDDLVTADREKTLVESTQRELRKKREEEGTEYKPKYFHLSEETDSYIANPDALQMVLNYK